MIYRRMYRPHIGDIYNNNVNVILGVKPSPQVWGIQLRDDNQFRLVVDSTKTILTRDSNDHENLLTYPLIVD